MYIYIYMYMLREKRERKGEKVTIILEYREKF